MLNLFFIQKCNLLLTNSDLIFSDTENPFSIQKYSFPKTFLNITLTRKTLTTRFLYKDKEIWRKEPFVKSVIGS